ncbi:MAG: VanZ family protein [Bacteroidaceae bacterium]|nr:VanZ family protein [Bacteroidaceae bacterium]
MNAVKQFPLTFLTLLVIAVLSLMPVEELPDVNAPLADKWAHMVMYGGLSLVIWTEYTRKARPFRWGRASLLGLALPVVYGGVMELAQAFCTTYRTGDWLDAVANTLGAVAVSAVAYIVCFQRQKGNTRK